MRNDVRTSRELLNNPEDYQTATKSSLMRTLAVMSVFATFLMSGCSRAAPPAGAAYIRANQLGYEVGPIRFYLMAGEPPTGSIFTVEKSDGEKFVSGLVGSSCGSWGKYKVCPMDFTVSTAGTYRLSVSGPHEASSTFRVDTAAQLFARPLNNALQFFQNQRDGSGYIPSALRTAPAHLNDQRANAHQPPEFGWFGRVKGDLVPTGAVVDGSGGWWDAGDYLKFVHTASYTETLMLVGVRDFPYQMGAIPRQPIL